MGGRVPGHAAGTYCRPWDRGRRGTRTRRIWAPRLPRMPRRRTSPLLTPAVRPPSARAAMPRGGRGIMGMGAHGGPVERVSAAHRGGPLRARGRPGAPARTGHDPPDGPAQARRVCGAAACRPADPLRRRPAGLGGLAVDQPRGRVHGICRQRGAAVPRGRARGVARLGAGAGGVCRGPRAVLDRRGAHAPRDPRPAPPPRRPPRSAGAILPYTPRCLPPSWR